MVAVFPCSVQLLNILMRYCTTPQETSKDSGGHLGGTAVWWGDLLLLNVPHIPTSPCSPMCYCFTSYGKMLIKKAEPLSTKMRQPQAKLDVTHSYSYMKVSRKKQDYYWNVFIFYLILILILFYFIFYFTFVIKKILQKCHPQFYHSAMNFALHVCSWQIFLQVQCNSATFLQNLQKRQKRSELPWGQILFSNAFCLLLTLVGV